jgi:phosphopantothenoylcysteine decarboxylase/phosphopantothenate--cysteine ligase
MTKKKTAILGVTGSIAAYKAGDIIRRLKEKGYDVSVVMTREAEKFITPLTLKSLAGGAVYRDLFDDNDEAWDMSHIVLGRQADVLVIAPATANIIGKIAGGLADDLLTCIAMATKASILIAPAMNDEMYKNKFVQENIAKLKKNGIEFIDPVRGELACGTTGVGHLADVTAIVEAVEKATKKR